MIQGCCFFFFLILKVPLYHSWPRCFPSLCAAILSLLGFLSRGREMAGTALSTALSNAHSQTSLSYVPSQWSRQFFKKPSSRLSPLYYWSKLQPYPFLSHALSNSKRFTIFGFTFLFQKIQKITWQVSGVK